MKQFSYGTQHHPFGSLLAQTQFYKYASELILSISRTKVDGLVSWEPLSASFKVIILQTN